MGRPFSNIAQISLGFEMYARGYQRHRIMDAFSEQARPSLRTLGNWTARYKKISDSDLALEDQFEWPHCSLSKRFGNHVSGLGINFPYHCKHACID